MIFNIQKCSIHDGTGLRTTVFFKGCPLDCLWCANPESKAFGKEIMEIQRKCIQCGACKKICPEAAINVTDIGFEIDREKCTRCMKCADVCYAESKKVIGDEITVQSVFKEINKDKLFYDLNGGGVTFSGGEPLAHPEFLTEISRMCKENDISTTIETCGFGNYELFKEALPFIDSMFIDLKHMDSECHKDLTGKGNELIIRNVEAISKHRIQMTIRTPIVPGYNDSEDNIKAIAAFINGIPNVIEYELLPYHNLGNCKYTSLGISYELEELEPPSDDQMKKLVRLANHVLKQSGIQAFYTKNNKKEIIR